MIYVREFIHKGEFVMDLIIRNARIINKEKLVDIAIKNKRFYKIEENIEATAKEEINAKGNLVSPPFVESHVHLDSALSAGLPRWNESGTLLEGIQLWSEYKETITKKQIKQNAKKTIQWLMSQGVLHIRTHTDCTEPKLKTLEAILELKDEMKELVDIQVVAFPQDGIFTSPSAKNLLEQSIRMGVDVIGGMPQMEFTREDGIRSIEYIFKLAEKYDKFIDIHTDETGDPQSRYAEVIAKYTINYEMYGRVTASHMTAMHNYDNDYAFKLIGLLKRAHMNVVTNPFSNTLLQNRLDGYPRRRGHTRVDEMLKNKLNVSIGNDNIMDPFNPLGRGNMLQAAFLLLHTAHLNGQKEIKELFQMITHYGAKTLSEQNYGIQKGIQADLIILDATNEREAIRLMSDCLYVIRKGKVIAQTKPAERMINLGDKQQKINFKR